MIFCAVGITFNVGMPLKGLCFVGKISVQIWLNQQVTKRNIQKQGDVFKPGLPDDRVGCDEQSKICSS